MDTKNPSVSLKDYLLDTINERDHKYEQRFLATDRVIADLSVSIKEALTTALTSTKDALEKANDNIRGVAIQQETFARKTEIEQQLVSMEKAVTKAETANEKRFEGVNEFRNTLADQQRTLMPRSEFDAVIKGLAEKIIALEGVQAASNNMRGGMKEGYSAAIGIIGVIVSVLIIIDMVSRFVKP
jgi:hypothetical protein